MAQRQSSTAVADDAPETLPPDFFDKKQKSTAPDTLPADFFDKKDEGTYTGEEEARTDQLPGATPRLKAAVAAGKAPKIPPTQFEQERPGEGMSLKGAGSEWWNKLKQMAPQDPTGGHSPFEKEFWFGTPTLDPAHGGLAQAGGEAAHEYERARKAGSGIIPSIGTAAVVGTGSLLGVSNKEQEEQAERGEGGKIIGSAAAPATVAAVAPLVGPALETGARGLRAGIIRPITDTLADRFATPAVAPGLSEAATTNLEEPIARRGVEKVLRATGMPSGQAGLRESFSIAAPDLAEVERAQPLGKSGTTGGVIRPDLRLRQTVENIDNRLDEIWKEERQPQIDRNAELPALSREQLLGDATPEQIKRIEKAFKMEIPDQVNLGDADKMLVKVNARLRRAEAMTPEARALALELSPDLQKFNEMKTELHQSIGGLLERVNEPGIKEFNRRYGALSEVRDALRNRMNPVEAERVLDSIRATGGLGRNVNLFERLHLKASPGRLAQKGLEDLSRSNLQVVPPTERPPVAGLLPAIPEPLGNGPDTSGATNLPVPEGHTVVPVPGGRFVRGLLPGQVPEPPPLAPPPVGGQYRIEPIGAPVNESILARRRGQVGTRGLLPAPAGEVPAVPPTVPPNFRIEPIGTMTDASRLGARGQGGVRIPDIKMLPETATAVPAKGALPFPIEPLPATTKPIMEGVPQAERNVPQGTISKAAPVKPVGPTEAEPEEVKIKGITAEEPKAKTTKRAKLEPVEKRFSQQAIIDAEGLLASEAGASLAGERPGTYYDESEPGDVRLRSRGAQTRGGDWRGVKSGRNMFPFLRENPDINPSAIEKALRNKDSAAYNRLIEKAIEFNRRGDPAYDFIRQLGENPDAEPVEEAAAAPAAEEPKAAPAPIIPKIGETGVIPGMEQAVAAQKEGAAKVAGENLTAEANRPKDISAAAGRMETLSPLFRGTEASPQKEIFGGTPEKPAGPQVPPTIEPVLKETGWDYKGKSPVGVHTIEEPGTNIKIQLWDRELQPDFVRRKIAEKEKQYGVVTNKEGAKQSTLAKVERDLNAASGELREASTAHKNKEMTDIDFMAARRKHDALLRRWEALRGEGAEEVPF